jgi:hypothetical protein
LALKERVDLFNDHIWQLKSKKVILEEEIKEKGKDAASALVYFGCLKLSGM